MSLLIKTEPVTAGALAQKPNICCICSNRDRLSFYAEILIIFWTYRGELLRLYEKFRFSRRQNRKKYCQTVLRSNIYNFENTTFIVSTPGIQLKVRVIKVSKLSQLRNGTHLNVDDAEKVMIHQISSHRTRQAFHK